jgi:phenylalanyl-tRNA synthetase beta chain
VDSEGVDWASRRCCELILDLAGGELAQGVIDVGQRPAVREPIVLRFSQLKRILGIDVEPQRVCEILTALGNRQTGADAQAVTVVPPSWRRDLSREIDLVEEVARIHGYDKIPEDVRVPMSSSVRPRDDRVLSKMRHVLTAAGFDEAMTLSAVDEATADTFSPWTDAPPLRSLAPVQRGADRLRRSLVPSLLGVRRTNEALSNPDIELFEIARVYLPRDKGLPEEERMLSLTSGRNFQAVKGVVESLVSLLNPAARLEAADYGCELLDPSQSCQLQLDGKVLGYLGSVRPESLKRFDLRLPTVVAELKVSLLVDTTNLVPHYEPLPQYPAVTRDLNFVVDESVRWAEVANSVQLQAGEYFESLDYRDTYRDPERLGPGKKSLLMTLTLRSKQGTLTNQKADEVRDQIVAVTSKKLGAQLRA